MSQFEYWKDFVFAEDDERQNTSKHTFYRLSLEDALEAENRMDLRLPKELRDFYLHIGYGFMCCNNNDMVDRLMDPGSVADFRLGEGIYEGDPTVEDYEDKNHLAFFEVSETAFITLDLSKEDKNGVCPVYYFDVEIAKSLQEFMEKMDKETDYYLNLIEE